MIKHQTLLVERKRGSADAVYLNGEKLENVTGYEISEQHKAGSLVVKLTLAIDVVQVREIDHGRQVMSQYKSRLGALMAGDPGIAGAGYQPITDRTRKIPPGDE